MANRRGIVKLSKAGKKTNGKKQATRREERKQRKKDRQLDREKVVMLAERKYASEGAST